MIINLNKWYCNYIIIIKIYSALANDKAFGKYKIKLSFILYKVLFQ